jgi:geranylgeranyl diphosphate synthase type II
MVGGQVGDIEAEGRTSASLDELEAIHSCKTGALLASALIIGARVAGARAEAIDRLATFGGKLGLAFQITDDLLDVKGDREALGKAVQKDAARGKLTYPSLLGQDASVLRARCLIAEACRCIEPFGEPARRLEALAHFVLERDH